mmetsp:Transcript_34484/g.59374  ORF Transcript_34484/g.59374 Transcript_34484/m.59374 type:complete len:232 (-) Transcript_34484:25-720(-)
MPRSWRDISTVAQSMTFSALLALRLPEGVAAPPGVGAPLLAPRRPLWRPWAAFLVRPSKEARARIDLRTLASLNFLKRLESTELAPMEWSSSSAAIRMSASEGTPMWLPSTIGVEGKWLTKVLSLLAAEITQLVSSASRTSFARDSTCTANSSSMNGSLVRKRGWFTSTNLKLVYVHRWMPGICSSQTIVGKLPSIHKYCRSSMMDSVLHRLWSMRWKFCRIVRESTPVWR